MTHRPHRCATRFPRSGLQPAIRQLYRGSGRHPRAQRCPQFNDRYTRQLVLAKPFTIFGQVLIESLVDDRRGKYDGRLCGIRLANDEDFFRTSVPLQSRERTTLPMTILPLKVPLLWHPLGVPQGVEEFARMIHMTHHRQSKRRDPYTKNEQTKRKGRK